MDVLIGVLDMGLLRAHCIVSVCMLSGVAYVIDLCSVTTVCVSMHQCDYCMLECVLVCISVTTVCLNVC